MTSLQTKLANELTSRGFKFTERQLEYVCNCEHELTNGKPFNQSICASYYLPEMVDTFLKLRSLTKFESDFNNL